MATGLMTLVDDCIKETWQMPKVHRIPMPLTSKTFDFEYVGPRAFMQHMFGRRDSTERAPPPSPFRYGHAVSAY